MGRAATIAAVAVATVAFVLVGAGCRSDDGEPATGADLVAKGESVYQRQCAACHGQDLKGTQMGPPFLNPIYAPNHHPDESFRRAVQQGVQPHHWNFGPMAAQPAVSDADIDAVIAFVRAEQQEAGITHDPTH